MFFYALIPWNGKMCQGRLEEELARELMVRLVGRARPRGTDGNVTYQFLCILVSHLPVFESRLPTP